MRLLVTGAMGYIGHTVAREALARGHAVLAQYRRTFRETDASLAGDVVWESCDLADPHQLGCLIAQHRIEGCIHTAAIANERTARPNPLGAVRSNVGTTAALLEYARLQDWRRFVYVGTGSVFQGADDITQPILEDAPTCVTNVYSTTKRCGELITAMYRTQGLSAATVRISMVYGPPVVVPYGSTARGPIAMYLAHVLANCPLRAPTGAEYWASFTFIDDVSAGLLAAYETSSLNHDVYHLGPGVNYSTAQVAEAVRQAVPGAIIEIGPGASPWADYSRMRGPLGGDRLLRDTGFKTSHSLAEGVQAYAEWLRRHPAALQEAAAT